MKYFLLDTNILLMLVRKIPQVIDHVEKLGLDQPNICRFTSVICHGELLALAERRGWGRGRRNDLDNVLDEFLVFDIKRQNIIRAYAAISCWTSGMSINKPNFPNPPKPAIQMAQNDLWIAATAHASNATLISSDKDFQHLDGIWFQVEYFDPKQLLVVK